MPITKRRRVKKLTKTSRQKPEQKQLLVERIKASIKKYARVIVFQYQNLSTSPLKEIQQAWNKDSKFFIGKNKVIQVALGKDEGTSAANNSYLLSKFLKGERALLFTNKTVEEVKQFCEDLNIPEYAKAGYISTENISLQKGFEALKQFTFSLEPHLRKLGLNTQLVNQQIVLNENAKVAEVGKPINVEQSKLLRLLGHKLAKLTIQPLCTLDLKSGTFKKI